MDKRDWTSHTNSRGYRYMCCEGEHVSLEDLKKDPSLDNRYLPMANIPPYPESVPFEVENLCHETALSGLQGIYTSGGFQAIHDNLLWWRPFITEDDIALAESKLLDSLLPWVSSYQEPFLEKFTTSPAFQEESRYGNFRFKFTVKELLRLYSTKFCSNRAPVLRVLDTRVYKQEIMYTILVHPRYITQYDMYPRLPRDDQSLCGYSGFSGRVSWRCQAPSKEYDHRLEVNEEEGEVYATPLRGAQFFVWDHVSVAFHMEEDWTLEVNRRKLMNRVSVCEVDPVNILRKPDKPLRVSKATKILEDLKRRMDEDY